MPAIAREDMWVAWESGVDPVKTRNAADGQGRVADDEELVRCGPFFTVRSKNSSARFQASRRTMSRRKKWISPG
jgi:hypothetical protein